VPDAPDIDTALAWRGRTVLDRDGNELGTLSELYLDGETRRPAWAGVSRGRLRKQETIVPLDQAEEAGDELRLPLERAQFDEAPDVDPDVELTPEQERILYEHYGHAWDDSPGEEPGEDTGGVETIRSEEEVVVSKRPVERVERVRLKKYLVTDKVKKTVPVRREVVVAEEVPPGEEQDAPPPEQ
jgi:PRC-barrel domain/Domain of unknown function (DUF2382)